MTIRDWDIVTNYIERVSTSKTVTFPKAQDSVKLTNKGNTDLTYTIGTKSGTLAPNASVRVNENLSSFTVSGNGEFEVWATEAGTEKEDPISNLPADVSVKLTSLESSLAQIATYSIKYFGAKCDGVTDDTEAVRLAGNSMDNIIVKFPKDSITLISDYIHINNKNVKFVGESGAKIKVKDHSEATLLMSFAEGQKAYPECLLSFFGDYSGIENLYLDCNTLNNYITINEQNYSAYYSYWYSSNPNPTFIGQQNNFGYGGIGLENNYGYVINCVVDSPSWDGIAIEAFTSDFGSLPDWTNMANRKSNRKVYGCTVKNAPRDSITVHGSIDTEIRKNKIVNPTWHAIHDYRYNLNTIVEDNEISFDAAGAVEMFPNHITQEMLSVGAIVISHTAFNDSEIKGSRVKRNKIKGNFYYGVQLESFAADFEITDNIIENVLFTGILVQSCIGQCKVTNNKININTQSGNANQTRGISFAMASSQFADIRSYAYEKYFHLDVSDNIIDNVKTAFINLSTEDGVRFTSYWDEGKINIRNNRFLASKMKPASAIGVANSPFNIPQLKINVVNNDGLNAYTTDFINGSPLNGYGVNSNNIGNNGSILHTLSVTQTTRTNVTLNAGVTANLPSKYYKMSINGNEIVYVGLDLVGVTSDVSFGSIPVDHAPISETVFLHLRATGNIVGHLRINTDGTLVAIIPNASGTYGISVHGSFNRTNTQ